MSTLFQRLRAKEKHDAEKRAVRAAKARERKAGIMHSHVSRLAADGLLDLPIEVAVAIEENAEPSAEAVPLQHEESEFTVEDLVCRLTAIRERLFWLQAVWATSLSPDIAMEGDRYRQLFHELGEQLKRQDAAAFDRIVSGHEALLLTEPTPVKRTLPLALQRWFELSGELRNRPASRPEPKPPGYLPDGLQSFL
jgi:hypothetical protein